MTIIILDDRIKELSRTTGTGDFSLDEAADGFSSFNSVYSSGQKMFYAISDGDDYEVGSGVYKTDGVVELLERNAFRSTNSDNLVNFGVGLKEVYVTHPGRYAVLSANGIEDFNEPQKSGVAIWGSNNLLDYDSNFLWNKQQGYIGLRKQNPTCAIDVGGQEGYSHMNVSGITVGNSGIMFSGEAVAIRGRQTIPFQKNEFIDDDTDEDTNIQELFQLSGVVNEYIGFKKQPKSRVFAGPSGNCGCTSDYPTFRPLRFDDIDGVTQIINDSGNFAIPTYSSETNLTNDISADQAGVLAFNTDGNYLMIANGTSWVKIQLS